MMRNRIQKFPKLGRNRNLQNLHVIPTASPVVPFQRDLAPNPPPQVLPRPAVIQIMPFNNPNITQNNFFRRNMQRNSYIKYQINKKRKRQRKRNRPVLVNQSVLQKSSSNDDNNGSSLCSKSDCNVDGAKELEQLSFQEANLSTVHKVSEAVRKTDVKDSKNIEVEEKTKLETVKNMEDETVKNMEGETVDRMETEAVDNMEVEADVPVVSDFTEDDDFEEVEVASLESEAKQEILVGFRKSKPFYLKYKKNGCFKPKIYRITETTFVNCLNVQEDVDVDIVSEAEYDYETDNLDRGDSPDMKIIDDSENDSYEMDNNQLSVDDVAISDSPQRIYKTCIDGNNDLIQGKSLIQNNLDLWKSHLIGLEYVIEIQVVNKNKALRYQCVLCSEDIEGQEFCVNVLNHIKSCKHVVKYLEKHFPDCGYKFTENADYNVDLLLKIAEEINQSSGYYFMCITNSKYFAENEQYVKEIIENAYHPNESDVKLDKNLFKVNLNSAHKDENENSVSVDAKDGECLKENNKASEVKVDKNITETTAESITVQVPVSDTNSVEFNNKVTCNDKDGSKNVTKKPFPKRVKGSCPSLTSYLKLSRFANSKLSKSVKKTSNATMKASVAGKSSQESEAKAESKLETEQDAEPKPEIEQNTEPKPETEQNAEPKPETEQDAEPETEQDAEPKPETQYYPGSKFEPETELQLEAEPKIKLEIKIEPKLEAEPEPEAELEIELKPDVKLKPEAEPEPGIELEPNVQIKHGSEVETPENMEQDDSEVVLLTKPDQNKKVPSHKPKAKVLLKANTIHSKYCRKRILSKGNSRLKPAAKASVKDEVSSGISNKSSVLNTDSVKKDSNSETIIQITKSVKQVSKVIKPKSLSQKKSLHKFLSVKKASADSKSHSVTHSSPHRKTVHKRDEGNACTVQINEVKNSPSVWKPIPKTSRSPGKSSSSSSRHYVDRKRSKSPVRKNVRRHSKSPVNRIKSPLRLVRSFGSPLRRYSRSPLRRHSKSPIGRKSRSPLRRISRSPVRRKSRSPFWKHSRSPVRRKSRTPVRHRSRSPLVLRSRSPFGHRSRSPLRRHSRSSLRRRSRSSMRRHSRSPVRHRSRSPVRQHSRSPLRRHSRSSLRRHSRSPHKHYSRSPLRRKSKSPVKRRSKSPVRRHSRSPIEKLSDISAKYRSLFKDHSPIFGHADSIQKRISPEESFMRELYSYDKHLSSASEFSKIKEKSKLLSSSKRNMPDKFQSHSFSHASARGVSDLDPVSDEDESIYFTDKNQPVENVGDSSSVKVMLARLLQKFSMADVNPNDPALNKLMQFMEAHSAEIQALMSSQPKPSNINIAKVDSSLQERSLFLQQYLLSSLAGVNQEPNLSTPAPPNMAPKFVSQPLQQPPFLPQPPQQPFTPGFGHPTNIPPPNVQPVQQRFFPPNVNVPPPQIFHPQINQINQPRANFPPKSNVPPEVMFKDLKATVSKLFGANESPMKQEKPKMPGYVTEPDPEKWDLNHPETQKHNASGSSKGIFHSQRKNIGFGQNPGVQDSLFNNNNNNSPTGQYFDARGIRPQIPNVPVPPPDAKVSFCEVTRSSPKGNLFPVVNSRINSNFSDVHSHDIRSGVNDVKVSLAQRLASVLVKVGMIDVPAPLLQEMLMKIGAFSSSPRQDISETEILSILKRLGYLS